VNVCEEAGFSTREVSNTKLAVDEACTNIIKHAYSGRREAATSRWWRD
jgi:anti-sigma regulatory factor (Ser/Thr protein kinase)